MSVQTRRPSRLIILGLVLLLSLASLQALPRGTRALAPAWQPGVFYAVGTLASYSGVDYKTLQAHTSQVGWEPPSAPALWERQATTATSVPTATRTRTATTGGTLPTATRTRTATTGGTLPTATRTSTTSSGTCGTGNVAVGKTAASSSNENTSLTPNLAVDGNSGTRWASAMSDPQWIRVDLGATASICRVQLLWEAAFGRSYTIQTSNDLSTWTTLYSTTTGDGGTDNLTGLSGSGRYVRMNGTARGTQWGYSLWEFQIYTTGGALPTATRTATTGGTLPTATRTRTPTSGPNMGTPIGANGAIRVCGRTLCNQYGQPIQLRGMSTHGLQWYGWNNCVTNASLDALANDWKADILRISMYIQEGGYETNPAGFRAQVDTILEAAYARGMYTIIDWHMLDPGDPNFNLTRAKEFFAYMAQKHGGKNTVLYEIANEPSGVTWATIKSYAEQVIPVIRQYDPDGIVLVGTPDWSSFGVSGSGGRASAIVANPLSYTNIMYVFHFYAASHLDEYRNELAWAADRLPVFVTEWGTQEYTGDGPNNFTSSQAYIDLMYNKKLSWTSWNYSDDSRTGAAFTPGTCAAGGPFTGGGGRLKEAGSWVRSKILNPPDNFPVN